MPVTPAAEALSDYADVAGLQSLLSLCDFDLLLLVLFEILDARSCDSAEVDEDIGPAAVLGDEPEALLSVEPLHCSCSHVCCLPGIRPTIGRLPHILRPRSPQCSSSV